MPSGQGSAPSGRLFLLGSNALTVWIFRRALSILSMYRSGISSSYCLRTLLRYDGEMPISAASSLFVISADASSAFSSLLFMKNALLSVFPSGFQILISSTASLLSCVWFTPLNTSILRSRCILKSQSKNDNLLNKIYT